MRPFAWPLALLALLALPLAGCQDEVPGVHFDPSELELPDARPNFTSSQALAVVNQSGSGYQINGLSFSASDEGDADAFSVALAGGGNLPVFVGSGETLELTVVFSPLRVQDYAATLTGALTLEDFTLSGGGCSLGCGEDAPEDTQVFLVATVSGRGDAQASFEECDDGVDNDDDGLVDCDDPDCATFPACEVFEDDCDDELDNDGDGLIDCDDPDCFGEPVCGGQPEICDDGIDNDGNGRTDCDDPACFDDPTCGVVADCTIEGEVGCSEALQGDTSSGEDAWQRYCDANQPLWTGPEHVYLYAPTMPGPVDVTLFAGGTDLDLTVLEAERSDEVRCDTDRCVADSWNPPSAGPENVQFFAEPAMVYLIVIDGFQGAAGEYELVVQCNDDPGEFDCGNGLDDDGDGLTDCADPDCFVFPECTDQGSCLPIDVLQCPSQFVNSSNAAPGNTNEVTDWCGQGFDGWTGPEIAYIFLPTNTTDVQITLGGLDEDLDLTVLLAEPGGPDGATCNPELCVDENWDGGTAPETVQFEAFAGQPYIIAIDGWDGAISDFTLSLDCGGGPGFEFQCDDGLDNDNDGATDCADPDCFGDPSCNGPGGEICNDFLDNDGDGATDCDDLEDCTTFPGCDSGGGDCCADNGSPGCDNQLGEDCVCSQDPYCCEVAWDGICADLYENGCGGSCVGPVTEVCDDGLDNDNDGLIDCADVDCFGHPDCVGPGFEFNCANGLDDDLDGAVDCDDFDCFFDPVCQTPTPEICDDGFDNDGDGLTDCDDFDCFFDPICQGPSPEICDDGADNEGDGLIDCADDDCTFEPSCDAGDGECCLSNGSPGCEDEVGEDCVCALDPFCCNVAWDAICADEYESACGGVCTGVEVCTNGLDDDGDNLADCDDPDCAADPTCQGPTVETNCTNGLDDDGDGLVDCADFDCFFDPSCQVLPEFDCDNNIDDDFDGLIDCADSDCFFDPVCNVPGVETNCANGVDDDGDGAVDCDDGDCAADPNCNIVPFEVSCDDNIDNDADGLTDCDDPDCAAFPDCVFGAETDCDNGIDDDADGLTDCNDSDCALDPNCAHGEFDCDDGADNDGDGLVDCDDDDCSADIACVPAGTCNPIGNIGCGDVITGSNYMPGSTNQQDVYCGYNPGGWWGPEVSWIFTPEFDGQVDISLTGLTEDLDIQALVDDDGCDQDDCEANGWNPPPQPEAMDWYAFAGTPYYILIDGWAGAESTFTMTIECTPSFESDCADNVDNDQDGDLDCADVDCLGNADCPELVCDDGVDNDADGFIDCNDVDCYGTPTCLPELNCVDGIDNDVDGLTDCNDPDCAAAPVCSPESDCDDGVDNDGDGDIDCDDEDCDDTDLCAPQSSCLPWLQELSCGSLVSANNADGANLLEDWCSVGGYSGPEQYWTVMVPAGGPVEVHLTGLSADLDVIAVNAGSDGGCDSGSCRAIDFQVGTTPETIEYTALPGEQVFIVVDGFAGAESEYLLEVSCPTGPSPELCDDGLDNDNDGDEDCFDSDCAGAPNCNTETICDDNFDNDADGLADCNDTDCFGAPGCPVLLFSSVDDDPADFVHFPLGGHSANASWELGAPNTSAQSGSGPASARTGSQAWCTGCGTSVGDGGVFNAYLVAQPANFDLSAYTSGTLELTFSHWKVAPPFYLLDLAYVDASSDGGNNINTHWGPDGADTTGWEDVGLDLSQYLGGDLMFGFRYNSLNGFGNPDADGWYIEDVELIWYP